MVYSVLLRSPFSHAQKFTFSIPDLPEGYRIFSADDVPGNNEVFTHGQKCEVFARESVEYVGQVIGILTGPDLKTLEELRARLEFNFEGSASLNESTETEVLSKSLQSRNFSESIFDEGRYDVRGTWKSQIGDFNISEAEGAFVAYKDASVNIFSHAPWISHLRETIENVTGLESEKITITRTNFNSLNTNTLWQNSILCAQVCVAALSLKKSVKLCLSRREQTLYVENQFPITIMHRTVLDENGKFIALDADIKIYSGAFNPLAEEILERLIIACMGVYEVSNFRINAHAFKTNEPPASVSWVKVDSCAFYAIENQIQKICGTYGFNPCEIREMNLRQPKKSKLPFNLYSGNVKDVIAGVAAKSDFNRKYTVYRLDEKDRYEYNNDSPFAPPLRGIGFACGFEASTYLGSRFFDRNIHFEITLNKDRSVKIKSIPPSQSILGIWQKIISKKLEIPVEELKISYEADDAGECDLPDTISADISLNTRLLSCCLDSLKVQSDAGKLPCTVKKSLSELVEDDWNSEKFSGNPFYSSSCAACTLELEFDPCTYQEKILGISVCIDAGRILEPKAAETAVKKACRSIIRNLISGNSVQCGEINVFFINSEDEPKQLGEIMYSILPAAFSSALSQAVAYTICRLPLETDTVYKLCSKARTLHNDKKRLERMMQVSELEEIDENETENDDEISGEVGES